MLVLSRGRNDKVVFPTIGMSVEILRIAGNRVRLGINAPDDVQILRHEIAEQDLVNGKSVRSKQTIDSRLKRAIGKRLQTAALGLHMLHMEFEKGETDDAEVTIFKIFNELKAIENEINPDAGQNSKIVDANRLCRALLVEDDANESELLAGYLRMSGFEVDIAMDGLQAMVHLAKNERPDIVLMDMRMPRFDGNKAVTAIRANPDYRGLKIFAVSGTERSETQVRVGSRGVDRWFSKPVNPQKIVDAIHEELNAEPVPA
jgi:carbon storage regulator CsrA